MIERPYNGIAALLIDFDGTDGNASAEGVTPNSAATFFGNATKSATQKRGNNMTSLALSGVAGSKISLPHVNGLNFGTGDFTVEGWFFINSAHAHKDGQISCFSAGLQDLAVGALGWNCHIFDSTPNKMRIEYLSSASDYGSVSVNIPAVPKDVWVHLVWQRRNGFAEVAINGTLYTGGSLSGKNFINPNSLPLQIGNGESLSYPNYWQFAGFIDSIRITKGVALYTSNFTPPESLDEYDNTGKISGTVKYSEKPVSRDIRVYSRASGKLLRSGKSDSSGNFQINNLPLNSPLTVISIDSSGNRNAIVYDNILAVT